ncbi:hypothetical protein PENTCL1PPCAC_10579 [Pristionchus entomophagus]|uniref:Uncharacterized protein n=1 Tax=Pristionchus entomophagus TaxID=358040 RepID=A0AAV5T772_9BILA|nr:hypothetical protein PENTCL1PPCAC_10579 [Pristionchus entomophagus]
MDTNQIVCINGKYISTDIDVVENVSGGDMTCATFGGALSTCLIPPQNIIDWKCPNKYSYCEILGIGWPWKFHCEATVSISYPAHR